MKPRLCVVGGTGGVGSAIAALAKDHFEVTTAGIKKESKYLNIGNGYDVPLFFANNVFEHVIIASGLNWPTPMRGIGFQQSVDRMMAVNFTGPMMALKRWLKTINQYEGDGVPRHFCVLGSNSALIPRSGSLGYCASKAALGMGIAVAAREAAKGWDQQITIWGVDPCWIEGTEMSVRVQERLESQGDKFPLHRIPGNRTLKPDDVASFIIEQILANRRWLTGRMVRMDAGEI